MGPSRSPRLRTAAIIRSSGSLHSFGLFSRGQVAVGFDGVAKARRRLLAPFLKRAWGRQAVEAVVDLDGVEIFGVAVEPARLRQPLGIEDAAPMLVHPPGAANADASGGVGNSCSFHRCS